MDLGLSNTEHGDATASELTDFASRRREVRQRVLLRARIHPVDQQHSLFVTNLSRQGLRGAVDVALVSGQSLFVTLDDITHCLGTVRWTQNGRFGVQFDKPLDILPQSSEPDEGSLPDHSTRAPRIATHWNGTLTLCQPTYEAKIRNVSKSGMMVETVLPLLPGQMLLVQMNNGKIVAASVRWTEGEHAGIQLSSPVSLLQFSHGGL